MSTGEIDRALAQAYSRPKAERGIAAGPPAPHFQVPAPPQEQVEVQWPATVTDLEAAHGDRFEALAEGLLATRCERPFKVLLFTSCHRGEGRSTLVVTAARAFAKHPGRTLLLDGDLDGPVLGRWLGLRTDVGLDDVVERDQPLSRAIVEAIPDRLWVLPLRAMVERPRDFVGSAGWSLTMARIRREFDLVLVDGGPLFSGMNAATLHRSIDAAVLVVHEGMTGDRSIARAREVLAGGGVPLLGIAETFVKGQHTP